MLESHSQEQEGALQYSEAEAQSKKGALFSPLEIFHIVPLLQGPDFCPSKTLKGGW